MAANADGRFPNAEQVSALARLSLWWVTPIVLSSNRGELTPAMTPELVSHLRSEAIVGRISRFWAAEVGARSSRTASLSRAYFGLLRSQLAWGVGFGVLQGVCSTVLRPVVLRLLIDVLNRPDGETVHLGEAIAVVSAFAAVNLAESYTRTHASQSVYCDCGSQFVSATGGLILQKALSVRLASSGDGGTSGKGAGTAADTKSPHPTAATGARRAKTPVEISNLLGNDVLQTQVAFMYMSFLTWGIVGFVGGGIMLCLTIGPLGAAAGIAVNLALVLVSVRLSGSLKIVQKKNLEAADSR